MVVHDISITQSYALTDQAATEEKQQFCALLKDTINKIRQDTVNVMGYLNAKVGADTGGLKQVKGKHELGPKSQHGDILVEWCTLNMVKGAHCSHTKTLERSPDCHLSTGYKIKLTMQH